MRLDEYLATALGDVSYTGFSVQTSDGATRPIRTNAGSNIEIDGSQRSLKIDGTMYSNVAGIIIHTSDDREIVIEPFEGNVLTDTGGAAAGDSSGEEWFTDDEADGPDAEEIARIRAGAEKIGVNLGARGHSPLPQGPAIQMMEKDRTAIGIIEAEQQNFTTEAPIMAGLPVKKLCHGLSQLVKSTEKKAGERTTKALEYFAQAVEIIGKNLETDVKVLANNIEVFKLYHSELRKAIGSIPANLIPHNDRSVKAAGLETHKAAVIALFDSICRGDDLPAKYSTFNAALDDSRKRQNAYRAPEPVVAAEPMYDVSPPTALTASERRLMKVGDVEYEVRNPAALNPRYDQAPPMALSTGATANHAVPTYEQMETAVARNLAAATAQGRTPFDTTYEASPQILGAVSSITDETYEASGRPVDPATAWGRRGATDPEFDAFKVAIEAYVATLVAAERTSYHFDFDHTQTKRHYHKGKELRNLYPAGTSYKKVEESYAAYMEKRNGPGQDLVGRSIIANPEYLKFFVEELQKNGISTHVTTYGNALVAKQALLDNGIRVDSLAGYGAATHMPGIHVVSGVEGDNTPQYFRSKVIDQATGDIIFSPDTTAEIARQQITLLTARNTSMTPEAKGKLAQQTIANLKRAGNIAPPDPGQRHEYIGGDKRDMMELQLQVSGLQRGGVAVLCDDSQHVNVENSPEGSAFVTEQLILGENAHIGTKTFTALVELQTERLQLMLKMLKEQVELPAKLEDLVQQSISARGDLLIKDHEINERRGQVNKLESQEAEVKGKIQGILPSRGSEVRGPTKTGNLRFVQNAQGNVTHYLIASASNPDKTKLFELTKPITAEIADDIEQKASDLTLLGRGETVQYKIDGSLSELVAHQKSKPLDVAFNDIDRQLGQLQEQLTAIHGRQLGQLQEQLAAIQGTIRLHGEQNAELLESQLRIQQTLNEEILPQQAAVEEEAGELRAGIAKHKAAITSIEAVVETARAEEKEKADAEQAQEAATTPRRRAYTAAATGGEADYMNGPAARALMTSGGPYANAREVSAMMASKTPDYVNGSEVGALMTSGGGESARPRSHTAGAEGGFSRQRHSTTSEAPTLPRKRRDGGGVPTASPEDPSVQSAVANREI